MYSNETYETIKERILSNMNFDIDKSEGSFTNDMISPLSVELAKAYIEFEHLLGIMFAKTSYDKWLDMKVEEYGLERKQGVKASGKVTFTGNEGTVIPIGSSIKTDNDLIYITTKDCIIATNKTITVDVEAVEVGAIYNVDSNKINALEFDIYGIKSVVNKEKVTGGIDKEDDEELRERFFNKIRTPATSGNIYHYRAWALETNGVKNAKVEPLWNGPGTVKVIVSGANNRPVTLEIIDNCKKHIEEVRPIGATVTVITTNILNIAISVTLVIDKDYNIDLIKNKLKEKLESYIISCDTIVYYNKIGSIISLENGVIDYSNLKINNRTKNIEIENNMVASLDNFEVIEGSML